MGKISFIEKERFNWENVLDDLCSNGFTQFLENPCAEEAGNWCESDGGLMFDNIEYNWGVTKFVIINDDDDFVLKIPFNGKSKNYCAREAEIFAAAVEENVEEAFAPMYFLMEYHGVPCYIMERIDCDDEVVESDLYKNYIDCVVKGQMNQTEDEAYDSLASMDGCEMIEELLTYHYDSKFLEALYDFFGRWCVNDYHTSNVGYKDERLVLCDYSGYEE